MHALALSDIQHPLNDVLILVENDVVCAVALRKRCLFLRRRRTNHDRPALFEQLRKLKAETASDRMHEDVVPLLHVVGLRDERERGQSLSEDPCSCAQGDRLGDGEDFGPRDARIFGE